MEFANMEKELTAVEWLVDKLKSQGLLIGEPNNLIAVRQANEIFEKQIIDALHYFGIENAEQYYNKTYGGEL